MYDILVLLLCSSSSACNALRVMILFVTLYFCCTCPSVLMQYCLQVWGGHSGLGGGHLSKMKDTKVHIFMVFIN